MYGFNKCFYGPDLKTQADTDAVNVLCARQRLTASIVVQVAWAILLGGYSREQDIVFGLTVVALAAMLVRRLRPEREPIRAPRPVIADADDGKAVAR